MGFQEEAAGVTAFPTLILALALTHTVAKNILFLHGHFNC